MSAPLPEGVECEINAVVKESGMAYTGHVNVLPNALACLRAAIAAAIEAEREACAEVASRTFDATKRESVEWAQRCAAAIRARGGA